MFVLKYDKGHNVHKNRNLMPIMKVKMLLSLWKHPPKNSSFLTQLVLFNCFAMNAQRTGLDIPNAIHAVIAPGCRFLICPNRLPLHWLAITAIQACSIIIWTLHVFKLCHVSYCTFCKKEKCADFAKGQRKHIDSKCCCESRVKESEKAYR